MIKTFLSALSVILFVIPIIAYSFFPSSNLNNWLSTRPILAQIYAFPNYGFYFKFRIFFPIFLQEK
ncbi:endonuclease/exonuclease/phosphatase family [Streptococcus pneumoniae]|nr:endonuclease/exonuclease/phosphatase family [Streptococcus pneumoniae]